MKLSTAIQLSRSRTPADRSRIRLTTVAIGLSGALAIGAIRIGRLGPGDLPKDTYSNYLAEGGLRNGVITVFVILAVLAAGLAAQALRIGVAARERRLTAVRLAGGTPRQIKALGAVDAALAGLAGGLLAAPIYLALSLVFAALPRMARLLPGADLFDLPAWLACALFITAIAAVTGWMLTIDRSPADPKPYPNGLRLAMALVTILLALSLITGPFSIGYALVLLVLPVFALLGGSRMTVGIGRRLTRSAAPLNVLAGARLIADSRPTGRMSTLLACCGLVVGFLASNILDLIVRPLPLNENLRQNLGRVPVESTNADFYLTGFAFATIGLGLIVATAFVVLLVGVADQLVDHRRELACLTAFGVDARFLRQVLERQLAVAACPALAVGLFFGFVMGPAISFQGLSGTAVGPPLLALAGLLLAAVGAGLGLLGARLAGYVLRNHVQDALAPGNLRAA
ncbi:FtsX-like permease family protein [Kribbella sp. NPDC051718]|uniref:FtsX-like permease family protein n=1 Tax=Kribbella sp. NPDC051718 TaxID=3155168 RepID=UPI0034468B73